MRFTIATQLFSSALSRLQNFVGVKSSLPILGNVLLEACGDELIMTATDLTMGMRCVLEAKVSREGVTTLPARRLAQLVREMTVSHLEVETSPRHVTEISAGASRFKFHGMGKEEFPSLSLPEGSVQLVVRQADLRDMLFRTSFAVSREDARFALTGVCMNMDEELLVGGGGSPLTFVGTDGKRLARARMSVLSYLHLSSEMRRQSIIPCRVVEELAKSLSEEGEATLYMMSDKIAVKAGSVMILGTLIHGDYPDVNQVIPSSPSIVVAIHREEMMALLRQIALFVVEAHHAVRCTFSPGELSLSANAKEIGEGCVKMPIDYYGGKLDIAFNPHYFLDILRHCKQETFLLGLEDPYHPGVIIDQEYLPLDTGGDLPLFILMPMRLGEE